MFNTVKNMIGSLKGFGSCSNCGDNWWWKTANSSIYLKLPGVPGGCYIPYSLGVMICEECVAKPESLDTKRIAANLKTSGWDDADIEKVSGAIDTFKDIVVENAWSHS
jgi:hypothetical protein